MKITSCTYGPDRDEVLVAFLYDELDASERTRFAAHVAECDACESELTELGAVRQQLAQWTPPEAAFTVSGGQAAPGRSSWWAPLREVPVWAQVAAALLVFGVAAGIANVEVRYDGGGLTVRTGWQAVAATPVSQGPSQEDLAAVEARMHEELQAVAGASISAASNAVAQTTASSADASDVDTIRRVRGLIADSERKQERELALRVAEVLRDVQAQRVSDLQRIDRSLGIIQSNTGVEVMRQRQLLNNLAVRVSQQQ